MTGSMGGDAELANRRQHERSAASFEASIVSADSKVGGRVIDISAGGAKVEVDRPIEPKTAITLSIERFGDYKGEIAWLRGDTVGVKFFEDPLVMSEVAYAMAVYGPA